MNGAPAHFPTLVSPASPAPGPSFPSQVTAPLQAVPYPVAHPSPVPPTPFVLAPGRDGTSLFKDARAGFSHLVPGRPSLALTPVAHPHDPPADAALHLQDAPVTIRYRLEAPSFAASSAGELAHGTAARYAAHRAGAQIPVEPANPTWLSSWGVEAAAVAAYDVAPPPGVTPAPPPQREDLFVLVRQGMVILVTWTYPRGFVEDPAYAAFASVAEATMVWDATRWEQTGRVWPESSFVGPGLYGAPKPKHNETARQIAQANLLPEERAQLMNVLAGIVSGAGAPWVPLRPDVLEANRRAVLSAIRNDGVRGFVEAAFAEVATAHDLRGLAVLLGRALEPRRSSTPPPLPSKSGISRIPKPPSFVG